MEYTLNDKQVRALYALLEEINLVDLNRGVINSYGREITPEEGRILSEMYFDRGFYCED